MAFLPLTRRIIVRQSTTQGEVPQTSTLNFGEFGINTFDGKIYIKYDNGAGPTLFTVGDAISSLGYTPVNKAGDTMTGTLVLNADPTQALHAATKQYVDNMAGGVSYHAACVVATTANISLLGTQTIDGVGVSVGQRVLVKNQTVGSQNGVYIVSNGSWSRATDFDSSGEVAAGVAVFVSGGTTQGGTAWIIITPDPITVGSTSITFTQFGTVVSYTAGSNLTLTGNTFALQANPVLTGNSALTLPIGSTGQRPGSPANGMTRYNSTTDLFEFRQNGQWITFATSASGVSSITAGTGITASASTGAVTLSLTDVGTPVTSAFVKITTNAKGQVSATTAVSSSDIISALGYTPVSPGGSNTQVQYNSSGSLAGSSNFTFDGSGTVTVNNTITSPASTTMVLKGGNGVTGSTAGGDVLIAAGTNAAAVNGRNVTINASAGGDANSGGYVSVNGGASGATAGAAGGPVIISGGGGVTYGNGGYAALYGGNGGSSNGSGGAGTSNGGSVYVAGGTSGSVASSAGSVYLQTAGSDRLQINGAGAWLVNGSAGSNGQVLTTSGSGVSWANVGSGTVTSVAVSGGSTGLTTSGGPVTTSGTITLTGTLALANGGTGATTQSGAANAVLPSQSGNANKYLKTDGTNVSWDVLAGAGTVTSVSVTTANGVSGSVANATSTPAITLTLGAITPSSVAASGSVTGSNLSGTNTGDQTITLTGDVAGSGTGSFSTTLATVNSNVGSFTNAAITVDAKGRITAASSGTGGGATTLTGDVTGSGTGTFATTLATVNSNVGTFASVTVNGKGLVTAAANLTGDATTSNSTLTLASVNSNVGTFTNATVTVDAKGRVTAASTGAATVSSFNTRTGAVTLTSGDVTGALTYTPVNKAGDTMTGFLTLSADPTASLHAATKNYVDNVAAGLNWKTSVRVATTANITLSGTQTIDGVALSVGNRVLVKDQTLPANNGIYVVASSAWTRATDFDSVSPIDEINSAAVFIQQGTINADTGWTQAANVTVIGTDPMTFVQFTGGGSLTAGTAISITGNTINNTGVTSVTTNTGLSTNASATGAVTITNTGVTSNVAGTGIGVSGATGAVTISNTGVTSAVAGTGISVSGATGAVTIGNTGVTSLTAGTGITLNGSTGNITISSSGAGTANIAGGAAGSIVYQSAASTSATLAAGTVNQVLVSGTTPAWTGTPTIASMTLNAGNLSFTSTGQRIVGDFTNATIANRTMFQTGTANSPTAVWAIPSGTDTNANMTVANRSGATNASYLSMTIGSAAATIGTDVIGTGTQVPLNINVGGSTRLTIATTGLVSTTSSFVEKQNATTFAASQIINAALGNVHTITLTANITSMTVSNVPASGQSLTISLFLTQDSTGGRTVTWPSGTRWSGGAAPTLTTTASRTDLVSLTTFDAGTTWYGVVGGFNFF